MFKWLDNHSGSLTAVATTILGVAAFLSYYATMDLLDQQKAEEQIQYRPYVSEIAATVEDDIPNSSENPYMIAYEFKNNGLTPAYDFKVNLSLMASGTTIDQGSIGGGPEIIGPGEVSWIDEPVSNDNLTLILQGSGNFLTLQATYQDYSGIGHDQNTELVSQKGTPGWVDTLGVLKQSGD